MDSSDCHAHSRFHVVAMPFPGRGHINPMMNVCVLLASKGLVVTFVVTEEWLSLIGSVPNAPNIHLRSIPNVIPSELNRGAEYNNFLEAVRTKMEYPFDQLLDKLDSQVGCIIADTELFWAVRVGNRRNIPVVSLFTESPMVFALFYHSDLLQMHGHYPVENAIERGEELLDYIPGIPSIRMADLPSGLTFNSQDFLEGYVEMYFWVRKAHYIVFTSFYELQPCVIDTLRAKISVPVYTFGPAIPYMSLKDPSPSHSIHDNYIDSWLDLQPENSVLYVSLGSFKPLSGAQMHEIAMGLQASGVRYLWIARGEAFRLQEACGDTGLVVPWCEQLKVLCHSSVATFLTHCGWNSTLEGVFAGLPMLTFPFFIDQATNSKFIADDWKVGLKVKNVMGDVHVVDREVIVQAIQRVMNFDGEECKELRRKAKELQGICQKAISKGGSSDSNIEAFIRELVGICH